MTAASSAVIIPFTFVGCSSTVLPSGAASSSSSSPASSSSSSTLSKGGLPLLVACPCRSERVTAVVRLSRPARLTRIIVRNSGSGFVQLRSLPSLQLLDECGATGGDLELSAASVQSLLARCPVLVPEHQLCASDVWREAAHSSPLPASLSRVHTFPSANGMRGSFSPQLASSACAALCVEVRGAEDEWSRDARLGISWLEVFGVPVTQ